MVPGLTFGRLGLREPDLALLHLCSLCHPYDILCYVAFYQWRGSGVACYQWQGSGGDSDDDGDAIELLSSLTTLEPPDGIRAQATMVSAL